MRRGEFARAAEQFKKVLSLDPDLPEAEINLGLAYQSLYEYDVAVRHLTKGLRERPSLVGPTVIVGMDYLKLGSSDKAIPFLQRALIAPADPGPVAPPESRDHTRFVSLADAEREIRDKLAGFARDIDRNPAHDEVYRPIIDSLERRLGELAVRGQHDLAMAAQLEVLPDQIDIILNKLATTPADVSEVIADVKLLLEQTDDAVRFAQDTRSAERHTLVSN